MLKILLKKQLAEVFKGYFYDAKKNRMRSKRAVIGWFVFFFVIMIGLLGGMFTALSLTLCGTLVQAGVDWLYFLLMGGIAVLLGAFGSVFNTYASLYLSKDNDLLLSLPIPVDTIIAARLMNVWLLGTMYASTALIPALTAYWITAGATAARVICGIAMFLIVTVIVLLLSCLLGWAVAKISLRLKHRSFAGVLVSLLFIGGYYFFYFKAGGIIRDILLNAETYGIRIKGAVYGLYMFGRIGTGDWTAAVIFAAATAALVFLVRSVLSRSFLNIATATGKEERIRYVETPVKEKTVFGALLAKEFARFTSSSNYMLNCGLGILLIPACGVMLLVRGQEIFKAAGEIFAGRPDAAAVLIGTLLCLISSMNDMAAPSVSLEGKHLWILQSLPVGAASVLRAKAAVQLILTGVPMLFAAVCAALVAPGSPAVKLTLFVMPLAHTAFSAVFGMTAGIRMPILNWTNETAPIKQSGAVLLAMFGGWTVSLVMAGLYLAAGFRVGAAPYLGIWTIVYAAAALYLFRWLNTRGAAAFRDL